MAKPTGLSTEAKILWDVLQELKKQSKILGKLITTTTTTTSA